MFNFMKKGAEKDEKEKEKRKKEKKEGKKKRESGMTAEELLRLDEVRRSLKIRGKRKEKLPSGITADYSENFFADLERDPEFSRGGSLPGHTLSKDSKASPSFIQGEISAQSDSSETSLNSLSNQAPHKVLPPLPPRPPKRGILKGGRSSVNSTEYYENHDSTSILVRNTLQNELITYQNIQPKSSNGRPRSNDSDVFGSPEHSTSLSGSNYLTPGEKSHVLGAASTSPSAESLTDTTNSSFATPPFSLSPVGESQGFTKLHSSVFDKNTDFPLPDIVAVDLPVARELTILRTPRGDFGFQLRRAIVTDKLGGVNKKGVTFAEPGALVGNKNDTGLLPGDVLLEVNQVPVDEKTREEIIDLIRNSGPSVTVKVQPIPELCELSRRNIQGIDVDLDSSNIHSGTLRRSSSQRFKAATTARSEEELASQRACFNSNQLWLVHRGGFTAVQSVGSTAPSESGKVKVVVEKSQQVLEVDEDDLEKVNPEQGGKVSDLTQLRYLNESSVLHVLRQRYGNNLIHTQAAGNMVVINPQCCLSLYNDKVASLFHGCKPEDMPPHVYALSQTQYRAMLSTRKDQSIVLLGRSGSGKTHNFRHALTYLLQVAGSVNKVLTTEKLNAMLTVVEAFGNARTCMNANATRCTNLVSLDFDQSGQIASVNLQMLMLEKQRIAKRPAGDSTYHVLHYLVDGAEGNLCKQLSLDTAALHQSTNPYLPHYEKVEDRQRAVLELSKLNLALTALGVTEKETTAVLSVLAAIYHLGHASSVRVGTSKWQFADPAHSQRAAKLLGTTSEDLAEAVWDSRPHTSPSRTPSPTDKSATVNGQDSLDGFVVGLYSELVNVINTFINRSLTTSQHTSMSLILADSPGLQNAGSVGQQGGAGFSDLCHNYVQERLHLLLHNTMLQQPLDRYTQEHIEFELTQPESELHIPSQLVSILDKPPPSGVLKTSQTDLRDAEKRGLLYLLDEESIYPNGSDDTFVERLFQHCDTKERQMYMRRYNGAGQMVIQHLQGTSPVVYNVRGWMAASKVNPASRAALTILQESTREEMSELFITGRGGMLLADSNQSLRRASSIRRTCNMAMKNKSLCVQVKMTADSLIETLRRTRPRFIMCVLAHHSPNTMVDNTADTSNIVNVPLLRSQVRGYELLATVRLYKQGYPEYLPHSEFRRRFRLLAGGLDEPDASAGRNEVSITVTGPQGTTDDEPRAVEAMLSCMDVDHSSYRIGLSQVFLRGGLLAQLEAQRDEKLADLVVQLQSRCRGYLARKKLSQLKIQDLAVRCIQRNVRKLMMVREWPWWRLYVKVTPLLNVHRTEEELHARLQELEALKVKLERVEAERSQLKLDNERLEGKVGPCVTVEW